MPNTREEVIAFVIQARDDATATFQAVEASVQKVGGTFGRLGDVLERGRGKIREFARSGSELSAIARALGPDFQQALGPLGEFIRLSGDIGLVASTVADLGPILGRAATGALGMGTAAAAATPEVEALAAAETSAAAAGSSWLAVLGPLGLLGAAGAVWVGTLANKDQELAQAQQKVATGSDNLYDRMGNAYRAVHASGLAYTAAASDLEQLGKATTTHVGIVDALIKRVQATSQSLFAEKRANEAAGLAAKVAAGYFGQFTTDAGNTGAALDNVQGRAIAAAHGLDIVGAAAINAGNDARIAAYQFATLAAAANYFNRTQNIANGGVGPGAEGPGASGLAEIPGMSQADYGLISFNQSHPSPVVPKARGGGGRGAGANAAATAQAIADAMKRAFDEARQSAEKWVDSLHDAKTKAINDAKDLARQRIDADHRATQDAIDNAHRLASEQIQSARNAVSSQLSERQRLNAEPVTQAEQALQATENAQTLRNLTEALQAAQQTGDPKQIRDAQESLSNFQQQLYIAQLRAQQSQADAQAQQEADRANAELDKQQKAEDDRYTQQTADEDARYQKRLADSDARYAKLQKDEDARYLKQSALVDKQIDALATSKKASEKLAQIEELRYLQAQVELAQKYGSASDVTQARRTLDDFKRGLPSHGTGLGSVPFDDYVARLHEGEGVLTANENRAYRAGGGGGFGIGTVNITVPKGTTQEQARELMYALQREMRRNGYTSLSPR